MTAASHAIAGLTDQRRISAATYQAFMPHRRVLGALEQVASGQPQRPALTLVDDPDPSAPVRQWTYARFVQDVRCAANLFSALADGAPRVALLLPPMAETHLALWGAETAGIACTINFQLNTEHIAELLQACGANILVALGACPDLDIAQKVEPLRAACPGLRHVLYVPAGPDLPLAAGQRDFCAELALQDGDRLAFDEPASPLAALFHTCGTTGAPKLAQHTHANQLHAAWGRPACSAPGPTM